MGNDDKFEQDIYHDADHTACRKKLDAFFGEVSAAQNRAIMDRITGTRVLDVGAGYGTLVKQLQDGGFDVTGIEPNRDKIACAREWYGLELQPVDVYDMPYKDGQFDCVILRNVVFHLDFNKALREISRVCRGQLIIFQGNSVLHRQLAQKAYGHHEFNERHRNYYRDTARANGFPSSIVYRDTVAFALSGGFIGRQFIPHWRWLYSVVLTADSLVTGIFRITGLARFLCLKYILCIDLSGRN